MSTLLVTIALFAAWALGHITGVVAARKDIATLIDNTVQTAHNKFNGKENKSAQVYSPSKRKENSLDVLI